MHVIFVGYYLKIQGIFLYLMFPEHYFGNIPRNFIGKSFPNIPRIYHGNVPRIFHEDIFACWDIFDNSLIE